MECKGIMGTSQGSRPYWKGTVQARQRPAVTAGRNKHRSVTTTAEQCGG